MIPAKTTPPQLPAVFNTVQITDAISEFSANVSGGFPVVSYRGKVWRIRKSGDEENYLDEDGNAMPMIEVVLIKSNPTLSKTFYDTTYEEGSSTKPRCWSTGGVHPDSEVPEPISKSCQLCPKNQWGSGRPTPSGAKSRACADVRRMSVVFAHELQAKLGGSTPHLLRVPAGSLNGLKDYAQKILAPRGVYPFAVVTKIGFDPQVAHPKLTFKAARFLTEEEAAAVVALRDGEETRRILAEATEFEAAETTAAGVAGEMAHPVAEAPPPVAASAASSPSEPPPAPAKPARRAKPRPAEDEVEMEEEAPPPKPVRPRAAPAAPAPAAKPASNDFDSMLDSILSS